MIYCQLLVVAALFCAFQIAGIPREESPPRVLNGIDVLREGKFAPLAGKRIALVTNHTGLAADGVSSIQLFRDSGVCDLAAVLSPEHGVTGTLDSDVESSLLEGTSIPVHSLYGNTKRPTPEMLKNCDALVFDIQDIGARFYTYITTLGYCMEEAVKAKIPFYVLDRPNPIGGMQVEGPMLDVNRISFTGYMPLPVRHGMTVGELARYFNAEKKIGVDLRVIEMKGWRRPYFFWDTGQLWVHPSPNMRSMSAAILYPGVCLLEYANISVGRGTDRPFEVIGAPWIEPRRVAAELDKLQIDGVEAVPVFFTPNAGKFSAKKCGGLAFTVTNPSGLNSVLLGLSIISVLYRLYPGEFEINSIIELLGNEEALKLLRGGKPPRAVLEAGNEKVREFLSKRRKVLIYDGVSRSKERR